MVIITTVLGGGGWIRFIAERNKTKADAQQTVVDSSSAINKEWEKLFDKYKKETDEEIEKLRKRVEHLQQELESERETVRKLRLASNG